MTSVQLRISIPQFLHDMAQIEDAPNKSARVQELMTKGIIAEQQSTNKNAATGFWTGMVDSGVSESLPVIA